MAGWDFQDDPPMVDPWRLSPLAWAAGAWTAGLLIGRQLGGLWVWVFLSVSLFLIGTTLVWRRWPLPAALAIGMSVAASAAGWWNYRAWTYGLQAAPARQLVRVEGTVEGPVYYRTTTRGELGRFDFRPPATTFLTSIDRIEAPSGWRPVRGRVTVHVPDYDGRVGIGDRVRLTGWLTFPTAPANPGERDRRREMRDQGIIGRLSLDNPGNCELLDRGGDGLQSRLTGYAKWALRHGLDESRQTTVDLLEVLLLGDWQGELDDVRSAFRRAGLMHILAISGLQLAILAVGAWALLLRLTGRPRTAALGALAAVGFLLIVVPPGAAIWRSGLMCGAALGAKAWGRRVSPLALLCGAALLLLIWQPFDLLNAGFQLTFLTVGAMIALVPNVSRWLHPPPLIDTGPSPWRTTRKQAADFIAATLVAWCVSAPILAYHFGTVVPAGLLTGLPAAILVTPLMWLGYGKIALTALWPAAGAMLAGPLMALAHGLKWIAEWTAGWPPAMILVPPPSTLWTLTAILFLILVFRSKPSRRPWPTAACLLVLGLWFIAPLSLGSADPSPLRVNMLAVGHGSCYLLRIGGQAFMYDCGSGDYTDITTSTVGPALREMGVRRIDTLFISHPDTDHYSGVVELADTFALRRVIVTDAFLSITQREPHGAAAYLIDQLRSRGVILEPASAGWHEAIGQSDLRILWPPPRSTFARHNDGSIILSVRAAGRSFLFTGDAQQEAMEGMLRDPSIVASLPADVMELPHHGATVAPEPRFLAAIHPSILLQSTSRARLRIDPWPDLLRAHPAARHVTALHGMVQVAVSPSGALNVSRFSENLAAPPGVEDYSDEEPVTEP